MLITKVHIKRFRGFHSQEFEVGSQLTAIAGQNGTQKSTLLGMITQMFTLTKDNSPLYGEKPLCGGTYKSAFAEKFRLSPTFDKPKEHEWTLSFDDGTDYTVESIKRTGSETIRFWQKGVRGKGDGYKQYPTIFLSLKRVLPLAESGTIDPVEATLTDSEFQEFKRLHNKILIADDLNIQSAPIVANKDKQTIGVTTDQYDWNQNSVGQDNLGKILLALFSFKRLKEKYPNDYEGGILAIDELDATMYPASQRQLLNILRKKASELNLQIFFTTHSLSLLESVDDLRSECAKNDATKHQVRLVYLSRQDNNVVINDQATFRSITLNLRVAMAETQKKRKITVYTEDKECTLFAKKLLGSKRTGRLQFVDAAFPCSMLIDLISRDVPAFMAPDSIIVLDGDVQSKKTYMKKLAKATNVLILPSEQSPERLLASFLHGLSDTSEIWANVGEGFTRQFCFNDITFEEVQRDRVKAKEWFNKHLPLWGRLASKVLTPLFEAHKEERDKFVETFDEMIKKF